MIEFLNTLKGLSSLIEKNGEIIGILDNVNHLCIDIVFRNSKIIHIPYNVFKNFIEQNEGSMSQLMGTPSLIREGILDSSSKATSFMLPPVNYQFIREGILDSSGETIKGRSLVNKETTKSFSKIKSRRNENICLCSEKLWK